MAKTLEEKIAATRILLAKYEAQAYTLAVSNNIEKDDTVTIKFGRGDKAREVTGTVIGVKDGDNGRTVAVLDADLNTYKVHVRDVIANPNADARNAADAAATEVAPEGEDLADLAAGAADEDPLSAQ